MSLDNENPNIENIIENQEKSKINSTDNECQPITHGEVIFDRKSSFQGHVATVITINQVQ